MVLKTLVSGYAGSGKSCFGLSHPKVAWLLTEPGSEVLLETHPNLAKNVVWHESFLPSPDEDIKKTFERLEAATVRAFVEHREGKIETLFLDNETMLAENRFVHISQYEKMVGRTGEVDTRAMYGSLGRWLYLFNLKNVLSFKGNVVISCHEMNEEEQNEKGVSVKTGNVIPNILGGFREKIEGMVSASLYLDKKNVGQGQYKYMARCQKGGGRNAKNRYGLPEWVENVSYQEIVRVIEAKKKSTLVNA